MRKLITALSMVTALAVTTTNAGCAWTKKEATVVKNDGIGCVHQNLGQTVNWLGATASVLFTVAGIIFENGATLDSDIAKLEDAYGSKLVACAVKTAKDLFTTAPSATPSTADGVGTGPADRAAAIIARRGWTFAQ